MNVDDGVEVDHLACLFADLEILEILHEKYLVGFKRKTFRYGMDPLHFATYSLQGVVAIYFLKNILKADFDVDVEDSFGSSPLHYSIIFLEEWNT